MSDSKVRITAETAEAERALKALGSEVVGLSGKMNSLTGVAGALGGVFSISAFAGFIKNSIDAADHLNDLSKTTSLTIEQLAGVGLAAKQSGSDLNGTAEAISKLSENMGKDSEKFAKMGIDAKDPIEAYKQLADVYNAIEDPHKKASFAAEALGKSWKTTAPLLAEGSQRIGEMIDRGTALAGPIKQAAEQADLFNDQMAELEAQASGAGISLANIALPALAKTATAMNDLVREGHPVLALWRGLAGMGQVAWDFLFPPENLVESMKSANRVKELKEELFDMERNLRTVKGGGMISRALYGEQGELEQKILIAKNQIATIEKHSAELDKKSGTSTTNKGTPSGVDAFIGGDKDHQAQIDALIEREQAKYDKLGEMAAEFNATNVERAKLKAAFDLEQMDKEFAANIQKLEDYGASQEQRAALEDDYQRARINRIKLSEAEITKIEKSEVDKRLSVEKKAADLQNSMNSQLASAAMGFLEAVAKKHPGMAKMVFAIQKGLAIAQAIMNTEVAYTAAMALGPAGVLAAPGIRAAGYTSVGLIAATAFIEGGSIGSGASSGGGDSPSMAASPGIPVSEQNPSATVGVAAAPAAQLNVTLHGIDPNSTNPQFTYDQVFNQLMPLLSAANGNGATDMNVIFA